MSRLAIIVVFTLAGLTFSCEKVLFGPDKATTNPYANFDYLWDEVDKKYSYFALKSVDWNAIRTHYRSQLYEGMGEEELFSVLASMLNQLRDDHTNLISPFSVSVYTQPQQANLNFHPTTVWENYIDERILTGSFQHGNITGKNIGYVRYSSFSNAVSNAHLYYIFNTYANARGIILDLRENGGGNSLNVGALLSAFSLSEIQVGSFITRNGPEHTDFSSPEPFMVSAGSIVYTKPVVVLIDKGSYSATTMFALGTKAMPGITLVGDTTGGGGGLPNGGQLPNGWSYRFSISQLLDLAGNSYAESGVPPDILADFDWSDLSKDEILDQAILTLE